MRRTFGSAQSFRTNRWPNEPVPPVTRTEAPPACIFTDSPDEFGQLFCSVNRGVYQGSIGPARQVSSTLSDYTQIEAKLSTLQSLESSFLLGSRPVGPESPSYVVFEAGPTHASLDEAKELVRSAANAHADAVKFQMIDPDRLISDPQQLFAYSVLRNSDSEELEEVEESIHAILRRRTLQPEEWRTLREFSQSLGLAFFLTVGFADEVDFAAQLGVDSIKIASADINHLPLIRHAARTQIPIQIDTGSATLDEVSEAALAVASEGNSRLVVHHCPSGYPARLDAINLRIISSLTRLFRCPIGFSDHSPGVGLDIAAIALGANLVEKTITVDRSVRSPEHAMSVLTSDAADFVRTIRELDTALGQPYRALTFDEQQQRKLNRRSAFLTDKAQAGMKLSSSSVEFRRPGFGLSPKEFEALGSATFRRDIDMNEVIRPADLDLPS